MIRIFIKDAEIDLNGDENLELNYFQEDISDITKKKSSFSNTIVADGTKNNNIVFQQYWEIGADNGFDINKKIEATLLDSSLTNFYGYIQLNKVIRDLNNRIVKYEFNFLSDTNRFIKDITRHYIKDVTSLSALTHNLTFQNIYDSWSNIPGDKFVYPMVDYERGYTIASISTNANWDKTVHTTDFVPAIYKRYLFDGIMRDAGYTYECEELNSERFTRQIILIDKLKRGDEFIKQHEFKAYYSSDLTFTTPPTPIYNLNYVFKPSDDSLYGYDEGNHFNTSTGEYTCTAKLRASFNIFLDLPNYTGENKVCLYRNGVSIWDTGYMRNVLLNGNLPNIASFANYLVETPEFAFEVGDVIKIVWFSVAFGSSMTIRNGSFLQMKISDNILDGDEIEFSSILPNITQVDFIKEVLTEFNLYVTNSKNSENHLILKSRDRYYAEGSLVDWSTKLDINKPVTIQPVSEFQARLLKFTNQKNDDYLNSVYSRKWNDEIFGQREFINENEFLPINSTKEIKILYANAICSPIPGSIKMVIPKLYQIDDQNQFKKGSNKPIHMYFNGTGISETYYVMENETSSYFSPVNIYPFCSHLLGNKDSPEFSLTWDSPKQMFYGFSGFTTQYPDNNLYDYYENMMEEYTQSKLLICQMHLTSADIEQLDFANQIFVHLNPDGGHYYKLISIEGYRPGQHATCKVTLMQSLSILPRPRIRRTPIIKNNATEYLPVINNIDKGRLNQTNSPGVINIGVSNIFDENNEGSLVIGQKNNLFPFSTGSIITGNENRNSGLNNAIIGGSGNTIDGVLQSSILNSFDVNIGQLPYSASQPSSNISVINSSGLPISGRSNITAIGLNNNYELDYDNTLYTRNLVLFDLTGATSENLGIDADGKVFRLPITGMTGSGESNTASNLGSGSGLYASKSGVDLQFKSLVAGSNITLTPSANSITIDVSSPSGAYVWATGSAPQSIIANNGSLNQTGNYSLIAGFANQTETNYSNILNGKNNITGKYCHYSTVLNGLNNQASYAKFGLIGGFYNIVNKDSGNNNYYSSILNGKYNWNYNSRYGFIGGGTNNTIGSPSFQSNFSSVFNGSGNTTSGHANIILNAFNSTINAYSNSVYGSNFISNGVNQSINRSNYSSVIAGYGHSINNAKATSIIGGANHNISSANYSIVLGGKSYTLTDSYTALVPKLRIANLPSASNAYVLLADNYGNVTKQTYSPGGGSATLIQPGLNTYTGGTSSLPTINISSATLSDLSTSGSTTITGSSLTIGSTVNVWAKPFMFANNTTTPHISDIGLDAGLSFASSAVTITGGLTGLSISATTYYSGSTPLSTVISSLASGTPTYVRNGTNTYTGGTISNPSVNVSALTINTLTASGSTSLETLSATTMFSGSTDLYNIFQSKNVYPSGMMVMLYNNENVGATGTATNQSAFTYSLSSSTLTFTKYKAEVELTWRQATNSNCESLFTLWWGGGSIISQSTCRADATGSGDVDIKSIHISGILATGTLTSYGISISQTTGAPTWEVLRFRLYGII